MLSHGLVDAIRRATIDRWDAPIPEGQKSAMWAERYSISGTFTPDQVEELRVCEGVLDIGTNGPGPNVLVVSGQLLRALGLLRPLDEPTLGLQERLEAEPEEPEGLDQLLASLSKTSIF